MRTVRVLVIVAVAWLVGRQWHPYFGFTRFLQIDPVMASEALPAIREQPIYVHPETGSYDGGYYAQIATSPALRDPALPAAVDDLRYRARRILLCAAAWAAGGGEAGAAMHAYAALNVVLWFVLAVALWRVFPEDAAGSLAWAGVLLGAGVLFSVRLALTDLAALLLTTLAIGLAERGRAVGAGTVAGIAGLARETGVLAAVALLPPSVADWRRAPRGRLVAAGLLAIAPLALWLLYIRLTLGGGSAGQRNLGVPFTGWWDRWAELGRGPQGLPNAWLQLESVLEHIALTVQVAYLVLRPRPSCPWWRVGAVHVLLLAVLGAAVWDGFPNAASRVLLPLTLAFNVRAIRDRAFWPWLVAGNLAVVAGVHAFILSPERPHELPAGNTWSSRHLLETDARWGVTEWTSKWRWAWCGRSGGLTFRMVPGRDSAQLELQVRGRTPRNLEVRHAGVVVWRGAIGDRPQWVVLPPLPLVHGRLDLELGSDAPPVDEGVDATARAVGIACYGARLHAP